MKPKKDLSDVVLNSEPLFISLHNTLYAKSEIRAASDDNSLRNYIIDKRRAEKAEWARLKKLKIRFGYAYSA